MPDNLQYPENIQREEPSKELLAQIYKELGATSYKIHKEKQVDVYLPRIDILSLLQPEQVACFADTLFQHLKPVVCFEVHTRSLDELTFAKWQIEVMGLFLMIAADLGLHYQDFVGYSIVEHVPETVLQELPKDIIIPMDPYSLERPSLVKIAGMIPWYIIFKPCLRYDLFCLPANLLLTDRHEQLLGELKQQKYQSSPLLEEMAVKVLKGFYQRKGATTMLDIASILEKSNDPSFVHFRKCRDTLLNEGRQQGQKEGHQQGVMASIIEILEERVGEVPDKIKHGLETVSNLESLTCLLKKAAKINTWQEFERALSQVMQKKQ